MSESEVAGATSEVDYFCLRLNLVSGASDALIQVGYDAGFDACDLLVGTTGTHDETTRLRPRLEGVKQAPPDYC